METVGAGGRAPASSSGEIFNEAGLDIGQFLVKKRSLRVAASARPTAAYVVKHIGGSSERPIALPEPRMRKRYEPSLCSEGDKFDVDRSDR